MKSKTDIMAPVGSWESLAAAIKAGCSSVYFGVEHLNMRARAAKRFGFSDLKKIVKICKENDVETYLTLNIVMYDEDLKLMKKICDKAKEAGISAVIATDIAAIRYARSIGLRVHASTQLNISNIEAVKFFSQYVDVIVLARELNLGQIKKICNAIKKEKIKGPSGELVRIEVFVHGALCVSISGKCYMSLGIYNHSANRGDCLQPCRRSYIVYDAETGNELKVDNNFVMSPKDLCCVGMVDKLIDAGISVFKIEGRGRSADYVYKVVSVYKKAVDSVYDGSYSKEKVNAWLKELETVFNRGFWKDGYYLGKKLGEWSGIYGSKATKEKVFIGVVKNYFSKKKVALFEIQAGTVKIGEKILITGPTSGAVFSWVEKIVTDDAEIKTAKKGDLITIPVAEKLRKNDKLYVIREK